MYGASSAVLGLARPVKSDPYTARSQLREDMEIVRKNPLARKRGWKLVPDYDRLHLWVDMWAFDGNGDRLDDYHVDMDMEYYRRHPPGVTFVNPETRSFDPASDMRWFPKWSDLRPPLTTLCFNPVASLAEQGYDKTRVFNNTMLLEYYFGGSEASGDDSWNPQRHTFFATLDILQWLLIRPCYEGRAE